MKRLLVALSLLVVSGIALADEKPAKDAKDSTGKVEVCHQAGKSGKVKTLRIGASALDAHLEHGDTKGPCKAATTPGAAGSFGTSPTPTPAPR